MENEMSEQGAVVAAIDLSDQSAPVVRWATDAARAFGRRLIVVHVIHDPGFMPGYYHRLTGGDADVLRLEESAQALFDQTIEKLMEEIPDFASSKPERRLVMGLPVQRIVDVADETEAGLLVVGSARRGVARLMLGSVALRVAQSSPVPVVIIPARSDR